LGEGVDSDITPMTWNICHGGKAARWRRSLLSFEVERKTMTEEHTCLMTVFAGRADSQSLAELNRLLDEGWRAAAIDPSLQPLPGLGNVKVFSVELMRPLKDAE
jgi:hypothetical protein